MTIEEATRQYCLRLADSTLIMAQRLAELCSRGPFLEEDIAMTNISLDLFGQARTLLTYVGEISEPRLTEDDLAFNRTEREYFNVLLAERPNGHFGDTIARNFLYHTFFYHYLNALKNSKNETLVAFAEKSIKEVIYHVRHTSEWVVRLGDGTEESHNKIQKSLNDLWIYHADMFEMNEVDEILIKAGIAVDLKEIRTLWNKSVEEVVSRATLKMPESEFNVTGRLNGVHSEHLGHMLSEMQYLPRTYPDAKW